MQLTVTRHTPASLCCCNLTMKRSIALSCGLTILAFTTVLPSAFASAFTAGDLVVVQYGDGSAALGSAATAAFLNEFSISGGAALQTIAMPTVGSGGNRAFT